MKRALISVSNKEKIVEFSKALVDLGYVILSTGGTASVLKKAGISVVDVSDYTGFPEILDGRVKTLHPKVHGGILGDRRKPEHLKVMRLHDIEPIDMVVVNLYPFEEVVSNLKVSFDKAIENIDIGGPTLIRAAAKNHEHVIVVVDPADYDWILERLKQRGTVEIKERRELAAKAFFHTSRYDSIISAYFERTLGRYFPQRIGLFFEKITSLRYGENPHQQGAFYAEAGNRWGLANAKQLQGKELSYNNILDLNSALALALEFEEPAAVIVKHNNPCGVGVGDSLRQAYLRALECDSISAYGGILAFNRELDKSVAEEITKIFIEAIIAPGYTKEAKEILASKENLRLIEFSLWPKSYEKIDYRRVAGGILVQDPDVALYKGEFKVVTKRAPTEDEWNALLFAWKVVKHVKSNAIVVANRFQTIGVGAGQMSRVDAVKIALMKARLPTKGAVMASDAFFPFADSIEEAAASGVKAVIQPGGSIRDKEVIDTADRFDIAMVFTGIRHFRH